MPAFNFLNRNRSLKRLCGVVTATEIPNAAAISPQPYSPAPDNRRVHKFTGSNSITFPSFTTSVAIGDVRSRLIQGSAVGAITVDIFAGGAAGGPNKRTGGGGGGGYRHIEGIKVTAGSPNPLSVGSAAQPSTAFSYTSTGGGGGGAFGPGGGGGSGGGAGGSDGQGGSGGSTSPTVPYGTGSPLITSPTAFSYQGGNGSPDIGQGGGGGGGAGGGAGGVPNAGNVTSAPATRTAGVGAPLFGDTAGAGGEGGPGGGGQGTPGGPLGGGGGGGGDGTNGAPGNGGVIYVSYPQLYIP